jgi:hypothetical protein
MKPDKIENLIKKFYAGETTTDEEAILRDYCEQENVSANFQETSDYFNFLQAEKELELDSTFDERILQSIDLKEEKPATIKMWSVGISSAAAVILVFLMVWFGTDLLQPKEVYGTISDPSLAFHETQKVLATVSKKMNKGLQPAEKAVKKVDNNIKRVGDFKKMDQALENAKSIRKIDKASNLLKSISKVYISYGDS